MIENNYVLEPNNMEIVFRRKGTLTRRKLREYIPVMILTNMSVFLLSTVDGLVAGNMVSGKALAAINIFFPAMVIISVISVLVASGCATSMATCMGRNDVEAIRRTKKAAKIVMISAAAFTAIVQFPIMYAVIHSYDLTPEVSEMAWAYSAGIMVAMPLGLISSVGSYQLQIAGKMRVLMVLSLVEGILNTLLDLMFAGAMHMGIAGIGLGTASAAFVRCVITVVYMIKKTDIFRCQGAKAGRAEIKDVLYCGCPDAANMLMLAFQNYFVMWVILSEFGDVGGVIKGVCFFAFNVANIVILGLMGSMRPLAGLLAGAGDTKAMRILMRQCISVTVVLVGIISIVVEIFPALFYRLNGVTDIPEGGILSLRLFALYFIFAGINSLLRLYFANRKDSAAATGLTLIGNATLPFFAFAFGHFLSSPFLWLGFLMTELLIFAVGECRYVWWLKRDQKVLDPEEKVLYLSVKPEEAIEASRMIRRFVEEEGCSSRIAYRMALCMEEMVAYVVQSQKESGIEIMIMARFRPNEGIFCMIDDGECIALNENKETEKLITDNYELIKKIAKSVEYQYVLNMNYTTIRF